MKSRVIAALVIAITLVLSAVPAQARATTTTATDTEHRIFYTADLGHIIAVSRITADDADTADLLVSKLGADAFIKGFNKETPGGFENYDELQDPPYPVRYADNDIVFTGTSHVAGLTYTTHLVISRVGRDIFFAMGFAPTATFYRYLSACNKLDNMRPAPHGYDEIDPSSGQTLPGGLSL